MKGRKKIFPKAYRRLGGFLGFLPRGFSLSFLRLARPQSCSRTKLEPKNMLNFPVTLPDCQRGWRVEVRGYVNPRERAVLENPGGKNNALSLVK